MLKNTNVFFGLLISIFFGCSSNQINESNPIYSAFKPILMDIDKITSELFLLPPKEKVNVTKLLEMDKYLLALEYGLGLHIYDISDKNNPIDKGFYQIPACIDFEVKDHNIYANNFNDFIIMDFTDVMHPSLLKRQINAFDIRIKSPDGLLIHEGLMTIPAGTAIISYEKL